MANRWDGLDLSEGEKKEQLINAVFQQKFRILTFSSSYLFMGWLVSFIYYKRTKKETFQGPCKTPLHLE